MKILQKIAFFALITVGILLIFLPSYSKMKLKEEVKTAVETIEETPPQVLQENDEQELPAENFDFSQVKEISPTATMLDTTPIDKKLIIGQLVIPSLDMNLCIFKGTLNSNLLKGLGTMKPDDKMGKGNFTLAGHNNGDKTLLFGSLMDIKKGAVIRITDKKKIYEYKVYETKIVPNTSLEMIENAEADKHGKPIISLMTCDKGTWTSNRFFAVGEFVKKYDYDKEAMEAKE